MRRGLLYLIVASALAAPALSGETVPWSKGVAIQAKAAAILEVRSGGDRPQIALADSILVELRIEGSRDLNVEIPKDTPTGWTLVEPLPLVKEFVGKDRMLWRLRSRFAPDQPGTKVPFGYPVVQYWDGKDAQTVKFAPVDFVVTTHIANPDLSQLRDKTEIEVLPPEVTADPSPWWWSLIAVMATTFVILAFSLSRFWRRTERPNAAQLALHELHRLLALKLPEKGHSERFITLLNLLIRQFLERQYSLPARRRTTPEFLGQLSQITALTTDQKQFLTTFFERCEHVKFANVPLAIEECSRWGEAARQFIEPSARQIT